MILQVCNPHKICYKRAMQCDKTTAKTKVECHMKYVAKNRSSFIQKIRDFFVHADFLEVETPIMTPIPGMEPHLTPFESRLNFPSVSNSKTADLPVYLNTSPELQMKKLLGSPEGFDKIFNITKVFRNGEMDGPLHNPEFTMIEWYRKNADYKDLMKDCENLILELVRINRLKTIGADETQNNLAVSQTAAPQIPSLTYQSETINLSTPWPRFTTNELFIKYCGLDLLENQEFATFKKNAEAKNLDTNGCENWDDIYFKIFLNNIEPELTKLNQPIFIYDYPASQAALAKKSSSNQFFAERFELYIKGIELANAFSELTDSKEQLARLLEEQNLRKTMGKTILPIDEEFLSALEAITTPTAGIALGLDRLIMLLLDKKSIEEVLLFPMNKMAK